MYTESEEKLLDQVVIDQLSISQVLGELSERDRIMVAMHYGYAVPEGYEKTTTRYQDIAECLGKLRPEWSLSAFGVKTQLSRIKAAWRKRYTSIVSAVRARGKAA